jgi:hypothetical protein
MLAAAGDGQEHRGSNPALALPGLMTPHGEHLGDEGRLAILLFPGGALPSRRWRWVWWAYLAASATFMASQFIGQSTVLTVPHLRVDVTGSPVNNPNPAGGLARAAGITGHAPIMIAAFWALFVARQVLSYLRASGERRQQLKWRACVAWAAAVASVAREHRERAAAPACRGLGLVARPVDAQVPAVTAERA